MSSDLVQVRFKSDAGTLTFDSRQRDKIVFVDRAARVVPRAGEEWVCRVVRDTKPHDPQRGALIVAPQYRAEVETRYEVVVGDALGLRVTKQRGLVSEGASALRVDKAADIPSECPEDVRRELVARLQQRDEARQRLIAVAAQRAASGVTTFEHEGQEYAIRATLRRDEGRITRVYKIAPGHHVVLERTLCDVRMTDGVVADVEALDMVLDALGVPTSVEERIGAKWVVDIEFERHMKVPVQGQLVATYRDAKYSPRRTYGGGAELVVESQQLGAFVLKSCYANPATNDAVRPEDLERGTIVVRPSHASDRAKAFPDIERLLVEAVEHVDLADIERRVKASLLRGDRPDLYKPARYEGVEETLRAFASGTCHVVVRHVEQNFTRKVLFDEDDGRAPLLDAPESLIVTAECNGRSWRVDKRLANADQETVRRVVLANAATLKDERDNLLRAIHNLRAVFA